jgi:hypothetical protein
LGSSVPLPKFQHPSHSLLEDNGFKQMLYAKWFKRCIADRAQKGARSVPTHPRALSLSCCCCWQRWRAGSGAVCTTAPCHAVGRALWPGGARLSLPS